MRRHSFGKGQRGISDAHLIRELLGLVIVRLICTETKTGHQRAYLVGNLINPRMGDHQQRKQNDDHENNDGERFGKPPCQRATKHVAEQSSRFLQQRHIETLDVRRKRRVKYGTDGPQDHGPSRSHTRIVAFTLGLMHKAEHH